MTKLGGPKRIHVVRARGGNLKYRALRLDSGNFSWGGECALAGAPAAFGRRGGRRTDVAGLSPRGSSARRCAHRSPLPPFLRSRPP